MNQCKTVSVDEIKNIMHNADNLFDIVRLVNPQSTEVIKLDGDKIVTAQKEPCFSVWEKSHRCNNCISLKACTSKSKMTKFEFRNEDVYSVLSIPFIIDSKSEKNIYALELVNKVTNNVFMHTYGRGHITDEVAKINHKIYEDSLTGTFNRRYFDEDLYIYDTMNTVPKQIAFMVIDVRKFKNINDTYGHIVGDRVLRLISDTLKSNLRISDCVIRMGGDEFLIILRECSEKSVNQKVELFKRRIKDARLDNCDVKMEINIGVAYTDSFNANKEQIIKLYNLADKRMYIDKKAQQ